MAWITAPISGGQPGHLANHGNATGSIQADSNRISFARRSALFLDRSKPFQIAKRLGTAVGDAANDGQRLHSPVRRSA